MPGLNFIRLIQTIALSNVSQGTMNLNQKLKARELQDRLEQLKDQNTQIKDNLFEYLDDNFLNRNLQFKEEVKELFDSSEAIINHWEAAQEYYKNLRDLNKITGDPSLFDINQQYLRDLAAQLSTVRIHNLDLDLYRFKINVAFNTEHLTKFVDSNQIPEYLQHIHNLSFDQTINLVYLSASMVILLSFISIFLTLYSNFLIDYFQIENKYPRLAIFLQLKKKIQHFFLFFDVSIITIVCLIVSYINFLPI